MLARFTKSWATLIIVQQYMQNKRRYAVRRGYMERSARGRKLKERLGGRGTEGENGQGRSPWMGQIPEYQLDGG